MKHIKLFENFQEEYLYHGTSYENAINMIENGLYDNTYWGDEGTAGSYADSFTDPVLIKIPLLDVIDEIEPNHTLINYYKDNEEDDDNEETVLSWEESEQTAMDSLVIFGSVILPPTNLNITETDIIRL